MARIMEQSRSWQGPAVFSYGFRPFFLLAAVWAAVAMLVWLMWLAGLVALSSRWGPVDWHVHGLVFGFLPAVIAGFLLTAVPNWTGRLPVVGRPLAGLVLVWLLGRGATFWPDALPPFLTAVLDMAFLALLAGLIAREIVAGRNWRNLKVLVPLGLLLLAQGLFHWEAAQGSAAQGMGMRLGLAAAVFLIALIGGRIVPSFTRNWLARRGPGALPAGFTRFDAATLVATGAALLAWVAAPFAPSTGALAVLAGMLLALRMTRWQGWRCTTEPLVLILHLAYAFVPLGLVLLGASVFWPWAVPQAAALHGWTAGAVGVMTLAVMTRASLGHTGQALTASPGTTLIYGLILVAALARVLAGFWPVEGLMHASALAWVLAFAGFAALYGPPLLRPRPQQAA